MRPTLHLDSSPDRAEAHLRAIHGESGQIIECAPGSVISLSDFLGPAATEFAREQLYAESEFRHHFLDKGGVLQKRSSEWTFHGLRRVSFVPFLPSADRSSQSILEALDFEEILLKVIHSCATRWCPVCSEPLAESPNPEDVLKLLRTNPPIVAIAIPASQNSSFYRELGYDTCIVDQRLRSMQSLTAEPSGNYWIVLDSFSGQASQYKRGWESIKLAEEMQPECIGLFAISGEQALQERIFRVGKRCSANHYTAGKLQTDLFRLTPGKEREQTYESVRLGDRSLGDILSSPLAELRVLNLEPACAIIQKWASLLLPKKATLLTPLKALTASEIQVVTLLGLLLRRTVESVVVVEEPYIASDPARYHAVRELLTQLSDQRNSILVIDTTATSDREARAETQSIKTEVELAPVLAPGGKILNWSLSATSLNELINRLNARTLNPPAAILSLPALSQLGGSKRTIADLAGLVTPIGELYRKLPVSQRYGLSATQVFSPPTKESTPLFRGNSAADSLLLTVEQAHSLFEQIPACARPLGMLLQLGLGHLTLDRQACSLSLGELNLLRLSQINPRPAKLRRIYLIEYPSCGLDGTLIAQTLALFEQVTRVGHTILLTDRHSQLIKWADKCLSFDPQEANLGV